VKPHAAPYHSRLAISPDHFPGAHLARVLAERWLLLPVGALIAVVWANTAAESYFRFAERLAFPVNEIGMAFFLALVTQEVIEALVPGGALHTWRRWGMSLAAAAGGIAGTAFAYLAYVYLNHEDVLVQAWPIACSVDIAVSYYIVKAIFRRGSALPFVLLLAIATDAIGLGMLAIWPPLSQDHLAGALLVVAAVGVAVVMRRLSVRAFWPYLFVCGPLSWVGFYWAGVHGALALIPIVPLLPHEPRPLDIFAEPRDDDAVHHAERRWNEAIQVVLFLFGLVNAGVVLREYDTGTWAMLAGALVGRPLGIVAAAALARAAGFHLPRRIGWRELVTVACATSAGFTAALFFAAGFLPMGAVLEQIKLGALATALGALMTFGVARSLRVGRFAG
jgi:NhaA family Na+:H+ antiporter